MTPCSIRTDQSTVKSEVPEIRLPCTGFTLIALFDGFVLIGAFDLEAPLWLVVAVGVLGVLI
jgi:hypothetical protein